MTDRVLVASVPRLALRAVEAAEALSVSLDFFDKHIRHELRWIRRGSLVFVAVAELQRWLDREAALTVGK